MHKYAHAFQYVYIYCTYRVYIKSSDFDKWHILIENLIARNKQIIINCRHK